MLYVGNSLIARVERSKTDSPSQELKDTVSPTVVSFLEHIESDADIEMQRIGRGLLWFILYMELLHLGVPVSEGRPKD